MHKRLHASDMNNSDDNNAKTNTTTNTPSFPGTIRRLHGAGRPAAASLGLKTSSRPGKWAWPQLGQLEHTRFSVRLFSMVQKEATRIDPSDPNQ